MTEVPPVPDMAELYRRLFDQLSTKFGGAIDEANADAIAYVAAELYHREFEPHLWDEKSAHEVLDALGAPRAGVFAPYSLRERLLALQRRIGTSEAVRRGHELLNSLGIPAEDEDGTELTLRQRIDRLRSAQPLVAVAAAAPPPTGNGAGAPVPAHTGLVDEPDEPGEAAPDEPGEPAPEVDRGVDEPPVAVDEDEPEIDVKAAEGEAEADEVHDDEAAAGEDKAEAAQDDEKERADEAGGAVDVVEVDEDSGAAPLVEAVRALEEAARVEAEMAPVGAAPVNVEGLSENLAALHDEVAALRTLVESLATDLRERLEAVHEEVLILTGKLQPANTEVVVLPKALEQTADIPPVPDALIDTDGPVEESGHKRRGRRLLLVVLLVLLGLLIAGLIVVTVVFGWDAVRDEMTGLTSVAPVFSSASPDPPEGVVP